LITQRFGGFLCEYQLFIHQDSEEVSALKRELDQLVAKFQKELDHYEEIMKNHQGEMRKEAEQKWEDLGREIDGELGEFLDKFNPYQAVVISMCSC
jgi:F0F1-type ATP synthase membrane subunit b/b'